jgi:hypothetical protein
MGWMARGAALALVVSLLLAGCVRVQNGFSLDASDDGTTKSVSVGGELRVVLPANATWNLASNKPSALKLKSTSSGSIGGSDLKIWMFDVLETGRFVLRATGDPLCRKDAPPCSLPTIEYNFTIDSH